MPWVTHFHMVLPIFKELKNIVKLFAIDCKYRIENLKVKDFFYRILGDPCDMSPD